MRKFLGMIVALSMASPVLGADRDIVDTAVSAGQFNTLVAAVKAAGLVDTLKSPGPFTVFAPTDEAFAKLPRGTVENLLKPENKEKLTAILTYHVVPGKVLAADVVKLDGQSVKTVQGGVVPIAVSGGQVTLGSAHVIKADIEASNGVIHVIDTVLLPPAATTAVSPTSAAPTTSPHFAPAAVMVAAPQVMTTYHAPARRLRLFQRSRCNR
jgi:uncharacterized surface protein with fasciclin (FAS1) repeats